jgi:hypothetical protein
VYSIVRFFRRKSLSRKPEKSNSNDEKKMNWITLIIIIS